MASCGCKLKPPQSYLHIYYGDGLFQCNSYLPLQILFSKYFLQNSTITHCATYLMFLFSEKRLENILRTLTTPVRSFENFWRTSVLLVGRVTSLLWTFYGICPGFQSQRGSLTCVLHRLRAIDSSDSPLVQHLLTTW